MRLRSVFPIASILFSGLASVSARAQAPGVPVGQNHYAIVQANDGKSVGSADCTVGSLASGYEINSHGDMKLAKFSYQFSNENRLDSQLNTVRDQLTGTVNGAAVTFGLESDSTGRLFNVNIQASGKTTANSFDRHQRSVLMPDLDPAAYIEMAHFALGNPPTAWIVIPKQNGLLVPANYEPKADAHGTLQGQPVLVHHTSVIVSSLNGVTTEIYYTNDGSLMEADLPEQNFFVIHDGFRLDSRPTYQPPRGSAPPPQQGEPQSQQPGQAPQQSQQPPQYSVPQGSPQPQIHPQSF
ncbi:MAG TPA: hypothetical protein VIY53_08000 [Acidobacteriaceae bacterium]